MLIVDAIDIRDVRAGRERRRSRECPMAMLADGLAG